MALLIPDGWQALDDATGGIAGNGLIGSDRQLEVLRGLAAALDDAYTIYHGVHWTNIESGFSLNGTIHFVIVNRAGDMVLIEQVAGFLNETSEGLVKQYPGRRELIAAKLERAAGMLRSRLASRPAIAAVRITNLLFCPHYTIRDGASAGIPPECIVDARRRDHLAAVLRSLLPPGERRDVRPLHHFLQDILQLEPDVSALLGRARCLVTRLSGGLAHWARQIDYSPFRLRVTATAGSGKTQLALAEFRATLAAGRQPLYVCFNRPLSDHFSRIVGNAGVVCSFHALCERVVVAAGGRVDFSRTDAFIELVARASDLPVPESLQFDTVIVDEGQDFSAQWRDLVFRHARPEARVLWLEDPLQNLYAREPVALPGWVGLRSTANYRSPRAVVRFLQGLVGEGAVEAASPIDTGEITQLVYENEESPMGKVKLALKECFAAGFRKEDIAVLSFRGREHSVLLGLDRLGDWRFRRYSGEYDLLGQPIYGEGEIVLESVYRFKGQSAPAVVLAEVDFEVLDERTRRKLFVGATRAGMKLVLVVSTRAAALMVGCLE